MGELLTVDQAADISGKDASTIRRACAAGNLAATRHGQRSWAILRADLDRWMKNEAFHTTGPKRRV